MGVTLEISDRLQTPPLSSGLIDIMNIHQMTLVLAVAAFLSLTDGFLTPIVDGLTISLPLLGASSTAGLSTVLAALGALKLGAALLLLTSSQEEEEAATYGAPVEEEYAAPVRFRTRRSTGGADLGSVMGLVEALDRSNCAKQLICQLNTKEAAQRTPEERLIMSLFSKDRRLASKTTLAEFDLAAKIGRSSRSEEECGNFYTSAGCPYTSRQMMTFFKSL